MKVYALVLEETGSYSYFAFCDIEDKFVYKTKIFSRAAVWLSKDVAERQAIYLEHTIQGEWRIVEVQL